MPISYFYADHYAHISLLSGAHINSTSNDQEPIGHKDRGSDSISRLPDPYPIPGPRLWNPKMLRCRDNDLFSLESPQW
jgi:hypothetical protein